MAVEVAAKSQRQGCMTATFGACLLRDGDFECQLNLQLTVHHDRLGLCLAIAALEDVQEMPLPYYRAFSLERILQCSTGWCKVTDIPGHDDRTMT